MDVKTRIRNYFAEVIPDPVGDDDDIFELRLADSMFGVQLVTFVEDEFSIVVENHDLDIRHFLSIAALTEFVESKLQGRDTGPPDGSPAH